MTIYRFKAQALTPIHVGAGNEIDPLEYILHDNCLVQFSPAVVLNRLQESELRRFNELLDKADLKGIQSFLRGHVDPDREGRTRIDVSQAFQREFLARAGNPDNRFRVDMMPRNPYSGGAYLPGSSIKGAVRTAIVNYFANLNPSSRERVHEAVRRAPRGERSKRLEESALNRSKSETERDVLRLLEVEDAALPDAATRIDRAEMLNPSRPGVENIPIWLERVKSFADSWTPPSFTVSIHLDTAVMQHHEVKALLGRTLDFDTVLDACNRFYWGRMLAEADRFDGRAASGRCWQVLHELFPRGKLPEPDAPIFIIDPDSDYWSQGQRKRLLLRIGRYSHFESLSVDELREGYNVQARRPITEMGATRTRCVMENGKPPMPFGWLLLTLESVH
ncbi:MAG: type III-A CRISPR-associated RAMP protein Csm5 [Deltaproteobacteria bacterium]|nr:type III-A CRISPR-associated RAMP protein Csm5 [Deltaproteobacteria bacterium]